MVGLLQNMIFPEVKGDPLIDDIIHKCWHNKYHKVADLAERTEALLVKESSAAKDTGAGCKELASHPQAGGSQAYPSHPINVRLGATLKIALGGLR
ncbi:uncharacterized protein ARB_00364 [Trichophyton benhamiae CBS 112371]|uniref:Uncharacterized protein n=1 Tax=Arthroderma benhamiae (strain ATCC MYA-4681 / CBS 112371) TaxID=663331 RepID=D4AW00_ARTBC|nr:uncharacterized protein ARB_00364 [Trichophyton benhamiae CBS 112371]EFE32906.1 hypothetical protein ARB_00364 [Trichophyton benhamiae CBS 112371]